MNHNKTHKIVNSRETETMQGVEQNFKRTRRNILERIETTAMKQKHDALEKKRKEMLRLKIICTHMTYMYIYIYLHMYRCMYVYVLENLPKNVDQKDK